MNLLVLDRLTSDVLPTLGALRFEGDLVCMTLEDRPRPTKVAGDTRIPSGRYRLRWRAWGRWAKRFIAKGFPGSLELMDVPDFSDILVHVGNTKGDTAGCILCGMAADADRRTVGRSQEACRRVYDLVYERMGDWQIQVNDL